ARVLAHDQHAGVAPDQFGVHDLVGRAMLDDAVLMDTGLVREGVLPDYRLVGRHHHTGVAHHQLADAGDLAGVDADVYAVMVLASEQGHGHLLEGGVARPFADAVDGRLDLGRAVLDGGQAVSGGQAQVVVAVRG